MARTRQPRLMLRGMGLIVDPGNWLEPDRLLGCAYRRREAALVALAQQGISLLVNLHERRHDRGRLARHGLIEVHLPVADFTAPTAEQLAQGFAAIERAHASGQRVAVHCGAGLGRTGQWFSWQDRGIEPDIATSAKALANGLPIGACLARQAVAAAFQPGDHGTTFGGGPVVCAAALAVLDEIEERDLLANCRSRSAQLVSGLGQIEGIRQVRGRGLLLAAVLEGEVAAGVAGRALAEGLIVNAVRPDAIRLTPPLTVSAAEVDIALDILSKAMAPVGSLHA